MNTNLPAPDSKVRLASDMMYMRTLVRQLDKEVRKDPVAPAEVDEICNELAGMTALFQERFGTQPTKQGTR